MNNKILTFFGYFLILIFGALGVILIELLPKYLFALDLVYGKF